MSKPTANNSVLFEDKQQLWLAILDSIRANLGLEIAEQWFADCSLESWQDNSLVIQTPNSISTIWIETNYLSNLQLLVAKLVNGPITITTREKAINVEPQVSDYIMCEQNNIVEHATLLKKSKLYDEFSFANFIAGSSNDFAHAAAYSLTNDNKQAPSLLYIYGGAGLGKSHLMQAIGQEVLNNNLRHKVLYTTSEQFINDYIKSIRGSNLERFRNKYRKINLLLIDDIEFLASKEKSQEELFHTFNELLSWQNKIVIVGNHPYRQIKNFSSRLISRFEQGLAVQIMPPSEEHRIAILEAYAKRYNYDINNDIIELIAKYVKNNIRCLLGALVQVASYQSMRGKGSITLQEAKQALESLIGNLTTQITIDIIQQKVADFFNVSADDMLSKKRTNIISFSRQVAFYLSRKHTDHSLHEIGKSFGNRDHSTVVYANSKISKKIKQDAYFAKQLASIEETLCN